MQIHAVNVIHNLVEWDAYLERLGLLYKMHRVMPYSMLHLILMFITSDVTRQNTPKHEILPFIL